MASSKHPAPWEFNKISEQNFSLPPMKKRKEYHWKTIKMKKGLLKTVFITGFWDILLQKGSSTQYKGDVQVWSYVFGAKRDWDKYPHLWDEDKAKAREEFEKTFWKQVGKYEKKGYKKIKNGTNTY